MSLAETEKMATKVRLILGHGEAGGAVVTLDPREAAAALLAGELAVVIQPPATTFETWTITEYTWQIVVISPVPEALDAWPSLDALVAELREPLELDSAALTMWQPAQGPAWPCASLTTTTSTID